MRIKKSEYKRLLAELSEIELLAAERHDALKAARAEAAKYRAEIEVLTSSPVIKADTESAFKRGQEHALNTVKYWLVAQFVEHMQTVEIPGLVQNLTPKIATANPGRSSCST